MIISSPEAAELFIFSKNQQSEKHCQDVTEKENEVKGYFVKRDNDDITALALRELLLPVSLPIRISDPTARFMKHSVKFVNRRETPA